MFEDPECGFSLTGTFLFKVHPDCFPNNRGPGGGTLLRILIQTLYIIFRYINNRSHMRYHMTLSFIRQYIKKKTRTERVLKNAV